MAFPMARRPGRRVPRVEVVRPQAGLNNRQKKQVKALVTKDKEKKFVDWYQASSLLGITASTDYYNMNQIDQGTEAFERDGNQIKNRLLLLNFHVARDPAVPPGITTVRILIFRWDALGIPGAGDFFPVAGITQVPTRVFQEQKKGFIIYDKILELPTGENQKIIQKKIPLNNTVQYHGDLSTEYSKGTIWVAVMGGSTDVSTLWNFGARLYFTDES